MKKHTYSSSVPATPSPMQLHQQYREVYKDLDAQAYDDAINKEVTADLVGD